MNKVQVIAHRLTYNERPVIDGLLIFFGLFLATGIDLTYFPEPLAVIAYELMLLTAITAVIHLIFIRRQKNHLR